MPSSTGPVRLRGHHLICMHFFHGTGHSPDFAKVVLRTLARLDENPVLVIKENDDVCEHCAKIADKDLCTGDSCGPCSLDALALDLLGLRIGEIVEFTDIGRRLPDGIDTWREHACATCDDREDCAAMMDLLYRRAAV